jgi:hypothetical protein
MPSDKPLVAFFYVHKKKAGRTTTTKPLYPSLQMHEVEKNLSNALTEAIKMQEGLRTQLASSAESRAKEAAEHKSEIAGLIIERDKLLAEVRDYII